MEKATGAYEERARRMVILCWMSYMILYVGKKTLKLCLPGMTESGILTEAQGGLISSVFLGSYAIGQLVNGWLGDRLHPRHMMSWGLILAGSMNVLMGTIPSVPFLAGIRVPLMTAVWALCGFFCSMLWAPLIRAVSTWTTEEIAQSSAASLSATIPIGTLLCQGIAAVTLHFADWRMVFIVCGSVLVVTGTVLGLLFAGLKDHMRVVKAAPMTEVPRDAGENENGFIRTAPLSFLLCLGLAAAAGGILFNGMIKDGLDEWIPKMLTDSFRLSDSVVAVITMILPLLNIAGVYAAKWAYRHYRLSELGTCALMFLVSTLTLAAVYGILALGTTGWLPAALVTLLFALSSSAMLGANTMLLTFIPLHFSKVGRASIVTGALDCLSYAAAAVTSLITGWAVDSLKWSGILVIFTSAAVLGAAVCFAGRKKMAEKYKELDAAS